MSPLPQRAADVAASVMQVPVKAGEPLLVHAGDRVRLWMQDRTVRIEMNGVVEQSARVGERVTVRITHQSDDAGLTMEQIGGVVRGAGDVEMER
jgi:flagella basal body P-ring formation protein FlgA